MKRSFLALGAALLASCGGDPEPENPSGNTQLVETTDEGDSALTVADATSETDWLYIDLAAGGVAVDADAKPLGWDIGLRRSNLRLNGGASGSGMGAAFPVAATSLESFEAPAAPEWMMDRPSDGSDDGSPVDDDGIDFALTRENPLSPTGWFAYDAATHVLTPAEIVWLIRGADGALYALQIVDWYDASGTAGVWRMRWKKAELGTDTGLIVDASDAESWTYLSIENGVVSPADPSASLDWDLAFSRTLVRTNSGTSGMGVGGAQEAEAGFEATTESPTSGFYMDMSVPLPGPPGSGEVSANPLLSEWYDYDPSDHSVSPKATAYLVRSASGAYAKLRILAWTEGQYRLELEAVTGSPNRYELEVNASEATAYIDLGLGAVVEADPEGLGWDLAITRTVFQTNSGVSGPGAAGVSETELDADLGSIESFPAGMVREDEMVDSGRPGVPPAPANPVLATWFDYNPMTHEVSPAERSYAVRTAHGHPALLRILEYQDGHYRLAVIFLGPDAP